MTTEINKKNILNLIKKYKILIFSKSYCPYCKKSKEILIKYGNVKVIELDKLNNDLMIKIQSILKDMTGKTTVPVIYINNKIIGGCDDLERLENNGTLKKLIN
jgi:glutaredoxin 3